MSTDSEKYTQANHLVIIGRVSEDIANAIVEEVGTENVIQSDFSTFPNGESGFALFVDGKLDDHPLEQNLSQEEKNQFIERIKNGSYITIVHSMSGAGHVERKTQLDNMVKAFKTFADKSKNHFPNISRTSNATSRATSLLLGLEYLKEIQNANVISIVTPKIAFDRQDRQFTSADGIPEYNAVAADTFAQHMKSAGADRLVVFEPHSQDSISHMRQAFLLDTEEIANRKHPVKKILKQSNKTELRQALNTLKQYILDDLFDGNEFMMSAAMKKICNADQKAFTSYDSMDPMKQKDILFAILNHCDYGPQDTIFPFRESFDSIAMSDFFARDIITQLGSNIVLSDLLKEGNVIFGSPDGMNKKHDSAVNRARNTRDLVYMHMDDENTANDYFMENNPEKRKQIRHDFYQRHSQNISEYAIDDRNMFYIEKIRQSSTNSHIKNSSGQTGDIAFLIDDIAASGGTQTNGAKDLKSRGVKQVHAYVCHAEMLDDALDRMLSARYEDPETGRDECLFDSITVTDTVPSIHEKIAVLDEDLKKRVRMISVKDMVVQAVNNDFAYAKKLAAARSNHTERERSYVQSDTPALTFR